MESSGPDTSVKQTRQSVKDRELGAPPLFQYYKDKEIHWCDATFLNPQTGLHDASVALQKLETGIALLKDVKAGTIVIDSGTDVSLMNKSLDRQWDWIQYHDERHRGRKCWVRA